MFDAGDDAEGVTGEEDCGCAHLAGLGDPAGGVALAHLLDGGGNGVGVLRHGQGAAEGFCVDRAGAEDVDADVAWQRCNRCGSRARAVDDCYTAQRGGVPRPLRIVRTDEARISESRVRDLPG